MSAAGDLASMDPAMSVKLTIYYMLVSLPKTYDVDTQNYRLNETVLLGSKHTWFNMRFPTSWY